MPVVPAAGYPTGPEAPPQVPLAPPEDYQRINATPEAFGAQVGQSMSALGRVLTTSADEFRQVAMERQQLHNNVVSDKAINDFNDKANNLLYGDPNALPGSPEAIGYYGLRGQAAIDAYPKIRDALQTSREQMRGQLENPMQQLNFDKETRQQMSREMGRAGSHYDQQYDVFQTQTNKAGATLADQKITQAAFANDETAFNEAVKGKMDWEFRQLQAAGLDKNPESVWAMQGKVRSDAVKTRIETYLGRNTTESLGNAARVLDQESEPGGALSAADAAKYRTVLSEYKVASAIERARSGGGGGGGQFSAPPGEPIAGATPEEQQMLNEIRARESTTNYTNIGPVAKGQGHFGAYQFDPPTWQEAAAGTGLGKEYATADKAPKEIQDANALWLLRNRGTQPWAASGPYPALGGASGTGQQSLKADFAKSAAQPFGTPEEAGRHLTTVTSPSGAAFRVHELAAPQIQGFINELEGMGYKIDPASSGGYNDRNKVGVNTDEKSEHAFGSAIDINSERNKQGATLITDLPSNIGQIAAKWGLKWGGTFEGTKDAMHFEVARLLPGGRPANVQVASAAPTTMTDAGTGRSAAATAAPYVIGDSLGVGLRTAGKFEGDAVGGRKPQAVLDAINAQKANIQGKTVFLSTGASNGTDQVDEIVPKQIAALKAANANPVIVGVDDKQYPGVNAKLASIAQSNNVPFTGPAPIEPGTDTHPSPRGYRQMVDKARAAAPGKPQTVPEGTIIYGPNGQQQKNVGGKLVDVTPRTPPPEM